ncbi:hypothetical protein IVA80_15240 [Bradyrhizobium sp. 139]|uniref:DUF7940 domain-containing protein n=1 Tax=Bradyrhizobium sp. 139 TaxID=2782616 RepID=UPI001FF76B13|nr:hypothetical protein [Bradyrhizobium sp. 139]MCK1742178.1 hypothetical protein [Bradyrhizobium sp. 139]
MTFIENAKEEFHRLWTVRIALFFGALNGFVLGLAAFEDVFNPYFFMALNILGWMLLVGARMLKQPGANPDTAGVDK